MEQAGRSSTQCGGKAGERRERLVGGEDSGAALGETTHCALRLALVKTSNER